MPQHRSQRMHELEDWRQRNVRIGIQTMQYLVQIVDAERSWLARISAVEFIGQQVQEDSMVIWMQRAEERRSPLPVLGTLDAGKAFVNAGKRPIHRCCKPFWIDLVAVRKLLRQLRDDKAGKRWGIEATDNQRRDG